MAKIDCTPGRELTGDDIAHIIALATSLARKRGLCTGDVEIASAINWGVYRGLATYRPEKSKGNVVRYAVLCALNKARSAEKTREGWRRDDESACLPEAYIHDTGDTRIRMGDLEFDFLEFVARHGKGMACSMLHMQWKPFKALLEKIELRWRKINA